MKRQQIIWVLFIALGFGMLVSGRSLLAAAKTAGSAAKGKVLYARTNCGSCHGQTGKGDGPLAKSLKPKPTNFTNRAIMSKRTDKQLFTAIKLGGPAVKQAATMPAYKSRLTDAQIMDVVAYLRTLTRMPRK